jgi:voltage-gated potassium channel
MQYIFSFYGIIDLLAIFPFYLNRAYDLRSLRAFRVFRVFRALKLIRYNKALKRFSIAAKIIREEMILFLMITAIFIFIASAGIYYFENEAQPEVFKSVIHSGWWAVVTLTTVGYGDIYPITVGGKVFTFFILIVGVGIVTIPAGLVASALAKARELEEK